MRKPTIETMQEVALSRGGKCLSKEYVNARTPLLWECTEGHRWKSTSHSVKNKNRWCPECGIKKVADKKRLSIVDMVELAERRGGKCLSVSYKNNGTKLQWECAKGHRWWARPTSVRNGGHWCPVCAHLKNAKNQRLKIDEFLIIAESRGGKCLSENYTNVDTKLYWECSEGHRWWAKAGHVRSGSWCPQCTCYFNEDLCRAIFEKIFEKNFPKARPAWLLGPKRGRMELDGYCRELGVAFEYQGIQHYKTAYRGLSKVHATKRLKEQRERDQLKRKLCLQKKVILIEVPYYIDILELKDYILSKVAACKSIADKVVNRKFKVDEINTQSRSNLRSLGILAKLRGGKCLSKVYKGIGTKLEWECAKGHRWWASPYPVKKGSWCPKCASQVRANKKRLTIVEMNELAANRGGKCLSKTYRNNGTKLEWECAKGHRWWASPMHVKGGTWCAFCRKKEGAKNRLLGISKMRTEANKKGGKCLSKVYQGVHTKLEWECAKGHRWWASPHNIRAGYWCSECKQEEAKMVNNVKRLKVITELAHNQGGSCLSNHSDSWHQPLHFECAKGHRWWATPSSIRHRRTWCPKCAVEKRKNAGTS